MPKTYQFPENFIWGTATAAFQVEGNNYNSDWWQWENTRPANARYPLEKSGKACDSYNRYEEDFDLCKKLNNNAVRFSIEWARIQPEEGKWDLTEIEHYRKVLKAAKIRGLKTYVTLLHFTQPSWIAKKGGWANLKTADYFAEYAHRCAQEYKDLIDAFMTINEPLVYATMAYVNGIWPPEKEDLLGSILVQYNLVRAHNKAYKAIKSVANIPTGIVKNMMHFEYAGGLGKPIAYLVTRTLAFFNIDFQIRQIQKHLDFIGLNYYFTTRFKWFLRENIDDIQSDLGWWVYPKGLTHVLKHLKRFKLPIYITENGIADEKDAKRKDFIKNMLIACHDAMEEGVDVRGYFYWSLIDNYEWHQGFWPRFGLVNIDRNNNLARIPRDSFFYYADICKSGKILE